MPRTNVFDSWEIADQTTAIKTCDDTFFRRNASPVPEELCRFFGAEDLQSGDSRELTFCFNGYKFKGLVSKDADKNVSISWGNDLAVQLEAFSGCSDVRAVFQKRSAAEYRIELQYTEDDWFPSLAEYDPGITKERWLALLNRPDIIGPGWGDVLAKFYTHREGASCKEIADEFGGSQNSVIARCKNMAACIHEVTGCPITFHVDGQNRYWAIMFRGRDAAKERAGVYVWRLRPELYDALTEFNILRFLPKPDIYGAWRVLSKDAIQLKTALSETDGAAIPYPRETAFFFAEANRPDSRKIRIELDGKMYRADIVYGGENNTLAFEQKLNDYLRENYDGTVLMNFTHARKNVYALSLIVFPDVPDSEEERVSQAEALDENVLYLRARERSVSQVKEETRSVKQRCRDPYIAEYAKRRAKGICQLCGQPAPFCDANGRPYLESHHIIWLSKGGSDSIENTVALCPNCHRKMHVVSDKKDVERLRAAAADDVYEP